ncbi:30S ribosomal protein S18 [Candidatus Vidania fulgoroideae]|uniref:30S ribosomal protein S18 n=1 Tax=Candidatus Vidania fulgoroideorum TaxID=881286 RepID=A0A975AEM3_9PROT|nr:30S ribosomal protein S18 [Candidatus Vidania fulgoroideae]
MINYRNISKLAIYIDSIGRIIPKSKTGVKTKKQKLIAKSIKLARFLSLIPYIYIKKNKVC